MRRLTPYLLLALLLLGTGLGIGLGLSEGPWLRFASTGQVPSNPTAVTASWRLPSTAAHGRAGWYAATVLASSIDEAPLVVGTPHCPSSFTGPTGVLLSFSYVRTGRVDVAILLSGCQFQWVLVGAPTASAKSTPRVVSIRSVTPQIRADLLALHPPASLYVYLEQPLHHPAPK